MHNLDALKGCWILFVFLLAFVGVPLRFGWSKDAPERVRVVQVLVRSILFATIAVWALNRLRVLGAISMFAVATVVALVWLATKGDAVLALRTKLRSTVIAGLRHIEAQSFGRLLVARSEADPEPPRRLSNAVTTLRVRFAGKGLFIAILMVVVPLVVVLRIGIAFQELRLQQPEQYSGLLRARELMLNVHPDAGPTIYSALMVTTSLLSGCDALQVARFLGPCLQLLMIASIGLLVMRCTRAHVATAAAIYLLGASSLPAAATASNMEGSIATRYLDLVTNAGSLRNTSVESAIGLLIAAIGLVMLVEWDRGNIGWQGLLDFGFCLASAALVSRSLGLLLLSSAALVLVRPVIGLFALGASGICLAFYYVWSGISVCPPEFRPYLWPAHVIVAACCLSLLERKLASERELGRGVLTFACLLAALVWFRPSLGLGNPLEYESAARQTKLIADRFERQTWVLVAPVEQLAESFGLGSHEDLAEFVDRYRGRTRSPAFHFNNVSQELFIYVEKKPYQIFLREPESVSFPVLMDATYRNYRSPGGRASLEADALKLCEEYRESHFDSSIFFEDDNLRIYQVHPTANPMIDSQTAQSR